MTQLLKVLLRVELSQHQSIPLLELCPIEKKISKLQLMKCSLKKIKTSSILKPIVSAQVVYVVGADAKQLVINLCLLIAV